jgi:hypothetical protein
MRVWRYQVAPRAAVNRANPTVKVSGTFDIECAEWSRFVVASTYEPEGARVHNSISSLVDYLLRRPGLTWFAHAGGVYDFLAVAEEMRAREIPCSVDLAGSRASRIVGGKIVLRDSWPLVPLPLSQAVEFIGERQMEFDPALMPCSCIEPCGGFCRLASAFKSPKVMAHVTERCASDARQLFYVLRRIVAIGAELDLDLRGTIGGTAWATAKRKLDLPNTHHSASEWRTIRKAYFGGRTAVIRPMVDSGRHFDQQSAYASALATIAIPVGKPIALAGRNAERALESDYAGIFSASVDVPDLFIPPLPIREPKRIVYPVGKMRGVWTGLELRNAMDRGVIVESVRWAITWPTKLIRFRSLMLEWWNARRRAGKETALGAWLRVLPSSLTGKLAENPDKRVASIYPREIRMCRGKAPCRNAKLRDGVIVDRGRCTGACGAYSQLDQWGQIWSIPIRRPSPCSHIEWAAHLTAAARIRLLEGMESQGAELAYSATDSVWTSGENPPGTVGSGLGDWEHKEDFTEFHCAAPGQYSYRSHGTMTVRTAGIRLSAAEYGRGFAKNDRGVLSFVEAAAASRGLFVRRNQNWNLSNRGRDEGWYGDRWLDAKSGITYPLRFRDGEQKEADDT